jgi:Mrp family chromosome partitioning ATPase
MALRSVLKVWPDLFPKNNDADQLRAQIAEKLGSGAVASTAISQTWVDLTPELAAATDPTMADLLRSRAEAQRRLNLAQTKYGEMSQPVLSAKFEVESFQKDIEERLAKLKSQVTSATTPGALEPGADPGRLTLADANDRLKAMGDRRSKLGDETKALQERAARVRTLSENLQKMQQELDTVQGTKHKLEFEGVSGGRTEVISPGDKPLRPDKDRRMPAAAAAGLGGLALGLALFALAGLFDRRVRNIADARESLDGGKRILGILPALPEDLADPDQVSAVAFAVHHIRTLLQLGGSEKRSTTFAITSAAPGDGKTSLTIALGMSYAATGAKTLLIDGDVIGAGLSSRLGAVVRPRLGSILVRNGLITSDQLGAGLAEARQTGTRIGRVLVKLGFIKPADKNLALAEQAAGSMGFLDMLDGHALPDCVRGAGSPNLSVMPVGNLGTNHVGQISVDVVRRIIAEARQQFDIVLFDTGPLLGSLEAGIVAAAVDEVVVAVARGQQIPLLDQTFRRLEELQARVAGIVFNRANIRDIERSGYTSSIASQRNQSPLVTPVNGSAVSDAGNTRRLGPIAGALAAAKHEVDQ